MYLVSRCLTGVNCKYDGGNNRNERVLEFCRTHKVCTVCPEGESGLGCPRAPAEYEPGGTGRIIDRDGRDVTKEFIRGAGIALEKALKAAKEAGNMVDLDSSPTKLIEVVRIGKQLLMTRGALTTFSIANDIAKYFAIIPVLFVGIFPGLAALNFMHLTSPVSAILSSVIYNALIIVALIPLSLKGVAYKEMPAEKMLKSNLLIYGLGGVVAPFIFIKLFDMLLTLLGMI